MLDRDLSDSQFYINWIISIMLCVPSPTLHNNKKMQSQQLKSLRCTNILASGLIISPVAITFLWL